MRIWGTVELTDGDRINDTVGRNDRNFTFGAFLARQEKENRYGHKNMPHAVNVPIILIGFYENEEQETGDR